MPRWPWFERPFEFNDPVGKFWEIVERVRGTPARLEERVRTLSPAVLTRRSGDTWSIQENVGHLCDLEDLHIARLAELRKGVETLAAADPANRRTHEAGHNSTPMDALLALFRAGRRTLVQGLEAVPEEQWGRSAIHPRLKKPMRIIDLAFFTAEHDDYHLARIGELIRLFTHAGEPGRR